MASVARVMISTAAMTNHLLHLYPNACQQSKGSSLKMHAMQIFIALIIWYHNSKLLLLRLMLRRQVLWHRSPLLYTVWVLCHVWCGYILSCVAVCICTPAWTSIYLCECRLSHFLLHAVVLDTGLQYSCYCWATYCTRGYFHEFHENCVIRENLIRSYWNKKDIHEILNMNYQLETISWKYTIVKNTRVLAIKSWWNQMNVTPTNFGFGCQLSNY